MNSSDLVEQLLLPTSYPHDAHSVELRETHISWVFLTGHYAYKLKKPVDLGFVNFSKLRDRHKFCLEEVRRNRQFSEGIYLDVVPVTKENGRVVMEGNGTPIDYCVKMRQFDDSQLASNLVAESRIGPSEITGLAGRVSELHLAALCSVDGIWGTPQSVLESALQNVEVLRNLNTGESSLQQLEQIDQWTRSTHDRLITVFVQRKQNGFIRECHGDLHLGNLVRWNGRLTPFDCIEFNPDFYWIDVMSEIAFLIMDLDDHQRSELGSTFLNAYLEKTGDYAALSILPFYLVYRAMVRAKVCDLRLQQPDVKPAEKSSMDQHWHGYLEMAARYLSPRAPTLTITHGPSGSGKTFGTETLIRRNGAIRIRSDVERKRLLGVLQASESQEINCAPRSKDRYSPAAIQRVYVHLADLASSVLSAGYSVLIDATFLKRHQRDMFRVLAERLRVPFHILPFSASQQTLRARIRHRMEEGRDESEANEQILEQQLRDMEPLEPDELKFVVENS